MRRPKLDLSRCMVVALEAKPKIANLKTGEVATDADGRTKYGVQVFVSDPESEDAGAVRVTVPSATPIEVQPGQPIEFVNLRVMHWEKGDRSGMAWSAEAITKPGGGRRAE